MPVCRSFTAKTGVPRPLGRANDFNELATDAVAGAVKTHIQKTAYAAKQVFGVPLDARFVLYKEGLYSFDVHHHRCHSAGQPNRFRSAAGNNSAVLAF